MRRDVQQQIDLIKAQRDERIAEVTSKQLKPGGNKREKRALEQMNQYKDMLTEAGGLNFDEASRASLSRDDIEHSLVGIQKELLPTMPS